MSQNPSTPSQGDLLRSPGLLNSGGNSFSQYTSTPQIDNRHLTTSSNTNPSPTPFQNQILENEEDQMELEKEQTHIWGTNINVEKCEQIFREFLTGFKTSDSSEPSEVPNNHHNEIDYNRYDHLSYYQKQLMILLRTGQSVLNLNCLHLLNHPRPITHRFYYQLRNHPQEIIPIMDRVAESESRELFRLEMPASEGMSQEERRKIQVRTFGLKELSRMRSLDPENIDQLICIRGMVVRCSTIIPDLKQGFFRCFGCFHSVEVMIDRGSIEEPRVCFQCQRVGSMELIHNRCLFTDKQLIRLQETPEEIPEGETPFTVTLFAFDDLVDSVRPGDRVEATGIFRGIPRRLNPRMRTLRSIFKTYVDVIHFRRSEKDRLTTPSSDGHTVPSTDTSTIENDLTKKFVVENTFSQDRIQDFQRFASQGDVYNRLVQSFAPSIWQMDDVKRGLLCMLFGGTTFHSNGGKKEEKARRRLVRRLVAKARDGQEMTTVGVSMIRESPVHPSESVQRHSPEASHPSITAVDPMDILNAEAYMEEGSTHPMAIYTTPDRSATRNKSPEEEYEWVEEEEGGEEALGGTSPAGDYQGIHQRGDINILLCGDPGTSKSQLLSYVHKLTSRGIYTSGKGSSAVGLTASVVRDPETNDMVLESGALVLSDRGICCIDEFDKMSDQTRAILHEAMEQQTVSITKAGIIATLNARTSILAAANPLESRYNVRRSVVENIRLPPTLLSRFDLIYLILDKPEKESDRRLAEHLVSLYTEDTESSVVEGGRDGGHPMIADHLVDQQFLKDYINYARSNVFPELNEEASEKLVQSYLAMRAMGGRGIKTISATPRQLESLIRISQGLAKMRLSSRVMRYDVEEAYRLMQIATQTAATDPRTGTIDMDMISTGRSALDRDLVLKLTDDLRTLCLSMNGQRLTLLQLRQHLLKNMGGGPDSLPSARKGGLLADGGSDSIGQMLNINEMEDAVKELEMEGVLQYIERTHTVIIRSN